MDHAREQDVVQVQFARQRLQAATLRAIARDDQRNCGSRTMARRSSYTPFSGESRPK